MTSDESKDVPSLQQVFAWETLANATRRETCKDVYCETICGDKKYFTY